MNLYEVLMKHFAPRDSESGVHCYLVAEDDKEVFEWIAKEHRVKDGSEYGAVMYNSWKEKSDKDNEYDYEEGFKERIINCKGDMFDEDVELTDLFYGQTLMGWRLCKENLSNILIEYLIESGIRIEFVE